VSFSVAETFELFDGDSDVGRPIPVLRGAAHRARMRWLHSHGYRTKVVTLPDGDRVVFRVGGFDELGAAPRFSAAIRREAARMKAMRRPYVANGGWRRGPVDTWKLFERVQGRPPAEGEEQEKLRWYAAKINGTVAKLDEWNFEFWHRLLAHYVKHLEHPSKKQRARYWAQAVATVQQHIRDYNVAHKSFWSDVGDFVGDAAKVVANTAKDVGTVALHVTLAATPIGLVTRLAKGERIDQAFLGDFKDKVAAVREAAPYIQTVVSLVPGVGTGVSAALGAATALMDGRPIGDALLSGVRDALPGGPAGKLAFDTAKGLMSGERIDEAALHAARGQLPKEAQKAFDIGVAVLQGRKLQEAVLAAVKDLAPEQVKSVVAEGEKLVNSSPVLQAAAKLVNSDERNGWKIGMGLMAHSGVNEGALVLARSKLALSDQAGFDKALKTRTEHVKRAVLAKNAPQRVIAALHSPKAAKREAARLYVLQTHKAAKMGDRLAIESLAHLRAAHKLGSVAVVNDGNRLRIVRGVAA
jgi:hypothetical protein